MHPAIFTFASSAHWWVFSPLNAGKSEGWIFSWRLCHLSTKPLVKSRLNPALQTRSADTFLRAPFIASSKSSRASKALWSITSTGTPLDLAISMPLAAGRLEITREISAGKLGSLAAFMRASMFVPFPEIRIAVGIFFAVILELNLIYASILLAPLILRVCLRDFANGGCLLAA